MKDVHIRSAIVEWAKQFYDVKVDDISSGSGVPKQSRLRIDNLRYAVKISRETGRISFTREEDGTWKLLSEVKRVLYARVRPETPNKAEILVFDAEKLLARFEETYQELAKAGQAHLPVWLSPEKEDGLRFFGSGYASEAITNTEILLENTTPAVQMEQSTKLISPTNESDPVDPIEEAKRLLAKRFGVSSQRIDIEVRIT